MIKVDSSGNAFSGEIPLEFLCRGLSDTNTAATWSDYLQELLLKDNILSGKIPTKLGSMKSLTFLLLQNNRFDGSHPSELGNSRNLRLRFAILLCWIIQDIIFHDVFNQ